MVGAPDASQLECGSSPRLREHQAGRNVVSDALVEVKLGLLLGVVVAVQV
jgi:hypothetical protein